MLIPWNLWIWKIVRRLSGELVSMKFDSAGCPFLGLLYSPSYAHIKST